MGVNRGRGLFEGGCLLVRLRIDMGAYLDISKLTWWLNRGGVGLEGGGGGMSGKTSYEGLGWGTKF